MLIDAHHHLWNLTRIRYPWLEAKGERRFFGDPSEIQRDYPIEDFAADWHGIAIEASVHIQVGAAPGWEVAETEWLDREFRRSGRPGAIVAFADVAANGLDRVLEAHRAASALLRGIRRIVSRHPGEDRPEEGAAMLANPDFLRGLRQVAAHGLSFDLQLTAPLLQMAAETFAAIPDLPVALCHAGSPWHRDAASLREWRRGLADFARLPGSVCKISGLGMFDPDWTPQSLAPIVEGVLEAFPHDRIMWGSNFPVDRLYRDYRALFAAIRDIIPEASHTAIFGETAMRFYRPSRLADPG